MPNANDSSGPNYADETLILYGFFFGAVAYGILIVLAFLTFRKVCQHSQMNRVDHLLMFIIVSVTCLGTIMNGACMSVARKAFVIDHTNTTENTYSTPITYFKSQAMGDPSYILLYAGPAVNQIFQEIVLLYRFWVFVERKFRYLFLPGLLFLCSIALSIMIAIAYAHPTIPIYQSVWELITIQSAIVMATNVLLTLVIGSRLFIMRRTLRHQASGNPLLEHFTLSAFIVESSVLYTIAGMVYMVGCITRSSLENLMYPISIQVQSIATLLIVMRLAECRSRTRKQISDLMARAHDMSVTRPYVPPPPAVRRLCSSQAHSWDCDFHGESFASSSPPQSLALSPSPPLSHPQIQSQSQSPPSSMTMNNFNGNSNNCEKPPDSSPVIEHVARQPSDDANDGNRPAATCPLTTTVGDDGDSVSDFRAQFRRSLTTTLNKSAV